MFVVDDPNLVPTRVVVMDGFYLYLLHFIGVSVLVMAFLTMYYTGVIQALNDYFKDFVADVHSSCLIWLNFYLPTAIDQEQLNIRALYYSGLARYFRSFNEVMEFCSVNDLIYWSMKLMALEEHIDTQLVLLGHALEGLQAASDPNSKINLRIRDRLRLMRAIYRIKANLRKLRRQERGAIHQMHLNGRDFYNRVAAMPPFQGRLTRDFALEFWLEQDLPGSWLEEEKDKD